ncbi:MAG: terminase large subunit [Patescibacteria group bacterium]
MLEYDVIGLDFGYRHPCAIVGVFFSLEGENKDWFRTICPDKKISNKDKAMVAKELLYMTHLTDDDLLYNLNNIFNSNNIQKETLIIADSARPETIAKIAIEGYNIIPSFKGAGSISSGIKRVKQFKLYASGDNLIKELGAYSWDPKRQEEPIKQFDHLMDAMRYSTQYLDTYEGQDRVAKARSWLIENKDNSDIVNPRVKGQEGKKPPVENNSGFWLI